MQLPQEIIDGILNPDGSSIEALKEFDDYLHSTFTFDLPKSYFMLLIASASWVALLILCGLPIFIVQIRRKKFWLIRFIRRKEGVYIVPNAITSFVICITLFGFCWIITCIMEVMAYMMKYDILQNALPAMQIMCWWPLLSAISCVAWGSFFSIGFLDSPKSLHRFIPRPIILNILCLGSPFFVGLIQIPLAVWCEVSLRKNLKMYHQLHQRIDKLIHEFVSTQFQTNKIQSFVLDSNEGKELYVTATSTLNRHQKAARIIRLSYAFWSILSFILLIFYAIVGYQLTVRLYRKMRQHYFSLSSSERCQGKPWHSMLGRMTWKKAIAFVDIRKIFFKQQSTIPRVERRPDSLKLFAYDQEMIGNTQSYVVHSRSLSPFHRLSDSVDKLDLHNHKLPTELHIQSISDIQISTPISPQTFCRGTPKERLEIYKYTYRCWISLTILYLSILMALSIFTSISTLWCLQLVKVFNEGPVATGRLYEKIRLICAWNCIIFGTSAAFAIISRIFDPAPESMVKIKTSPVLQHIRTPYTPRRISEDLNLTAMQVILSPLGRVPQHTTLQPSIHSTYQATETAAMEGIGLSYFSKNDDGAPCQDKLKRTERARIQLSCDNIDRLDRLEEYTDLTIRYTT